MSERINPGDELYATLIAARREQGNAEVVGYQGAFYQHFQDGTTDAFVLLERKPEKDSRGKPSKVHRGWYPPEVNE